MSIAEYRGQTIEVGSWNYSNAEVGMRKWEKREGGSGNYSNAEVGPVVVPKGWDYSDEYMQNQHLQIHPVSFL